MVGRTASEAAAFLQPADRLQQVYEEARARCLAGEPGVSMHLGQLLRRRRRSSVFWRVTSVEVLPREWTGDLDTNRKRLCQVVEHLLFGNAQQRAERSLEAQQQ